MHEWHNDGGFSLDAAVRIPAWDRAGLERLLRYCTRTDEAAPEPDSGESSVLDQPSRSPARYLWATLIARLFELFPLTCRDCGAEMKIIAFVTETPSVRALLEHIGEPTSPPAISPARGPPIWEDAQLELDPDYDPIAQPEPEVEFDQRVQW